jgi:hypothetical protein
MYSNTLDNESKIVENMLAVSNVIQIYLKKCGVTSLRVRNKIEIKCGSNMENLSNSDKYYEFHWKINKSGVDLGHIASSDQSNTTAYKSGLPSAYFELEHVCLPKGIHLSFNKGYFCSISYCDD